MDIRAIRGYSAYDDGDNLRNKAYSGEEVLFSSRLIYFILIFTPLFSLLEITSYRNISWVAFFIFFVGIVALFYKLSWGVLYYLAITMLSTDTPFALLSTEFSSVQTIRFLGSTVSTWWTLFVLLASVLYIFVHKDRVTKAPSMYLDQLMITMGGLFALAAIWGLRLPEPSISIWVSDVSYYINMAIIYLAVRLISQDNRSFQALLAVLLASLIVRGGAGLVYFVVGLGNWAGANVRTVTDSVGNIFPLLVFLGAAYMIRPISFRQDHKLGRVLIAGSVLGAFSLFTYASRANIIMTLVGIIVMMAINSRVSKGQRRRGSRTSALKMIIFTTILVCISLWLMQKIRPGSLDYVVWKLNTLTDISYDDQLSSASVRWLEFKNIVPYLWERGNILWGEGLGGWFTDIYYPFAMSLTGGSGFPDTWILQGRLYKPHGTQLVILLKMGVIGIILYFGLLVMAFFESVRILRRCTDSFVRIFLLAILAYMPLLFYKNFNSKMQITMGLLLAIVAVANAMQLSKRSKVHGDEDAIAVYRPS